MRFFTALEIAPSQKQFLAGLRTTIPGTSWVPIENYHLTLRFVGEVRSRHMADEIDFALSRVQSTPFDLHLGGIGVTTTPRGQRLWMGAEPNESLKRLQARIESALRRIGLAPDTRRFIPHVTLAHAQWGPQAERWVQLHSLMRAEPMTIDHFTLMESYRGADFPHYESCVDYPLEPRLLAAQ